jgi:thiol:disulfide interchange protein
MKLFRSLVLALVAVFISLEMSAQIVQDPTVWTYEVKKKDGNKYELWFHLVLKNDYHIYSFDPGGDGTLLPPKFDFKKNASVKLLGKVKEKGTIKTETIEEIGTIRYFKHKADYVQEIEVTGNTSVTGVHEYQVCNDVGCLAPVRKDFSFAITDAAIMAGVDAPMPVDTNVAVVTNADTVVVAATNDGPTIGSAGNTSATTTDGAAPKEKKSLIWLFLASFGGGIAALLTPCVYSMIPITVSFFTKRSKTRAEGIRNAFYYSLSIILIFTILGVVLSLAFGDDALYRISTHWTANLFFFLIFVIFGISFLGAFEITLPSSWTSKTDSRAGTSSFMGIFFMALTLVIVSFSCTGPIVGPLIVYASKGGIAGPTVGLFGFSLGLALPFALFAIFPSLLNKIATSGGWMNQVKVTLGFLELGLAMKFFSNADLAKHWRILDREIFIAIWIVLAVLMGMYLLGKLKLSKDDAQPKNVFGQEYVSLFKLFLAIASFSFAVYLLPGMWGAPLNGMGQFVPPIGTQDFVIGEGGGHPPAGPAESGGPVNYVTEMKIYEPEVARKYGLKTYFDYDEALAASIKFKKPIMLDFTGITCVNCRKMETQVWSNPEIMRRLKEDFIVASLYCDAFDVPLLPGKEFFSTARNKQISSLGDWCLDLQVTKFESNTQPFYFFVDETGTKLAPEGYGYNPNIEKFAAHLDAVKAKYKALHP